MNELNYPRGAVYILENLAAQRVKVGMTINDVADRLRSVNDMWLDQKVTCQICGGRRQLNNKGFISNHVVSGKFCKGGNELPLERDVMLAESHLEHLKNNFSNYSRSEKGSFVRAANKLKHRIELYRNREKPIGVWEIGVVFYSDRIDQVESLAHKNLASYLDRTALFGEVFECSLQIAVEAVEAVLSQLGLLTSAKKDDQLRQIRGVYLKYLDYQEPERKAAKYECAICDTQWEGIEPGVNPCPNCKTHMYNRLLSYS